MIHWSAKIPSKLQILTHQEHNVVLTHKMDSWASHMAIRSATCLIKSQSPHSCFHKLKWCQARALRKAFLFRRKSTIPKFNLLSRINCWTTSLMFYKVSLLPNRRMPINHSNSTSSQPLFCHILTSPKSSASQATDLRAIDSKIWRLQTQFSWKWRRATPTLL